MGEFGRSFNQFLDAVREYKPFIDSSLDAPLGEVMKLMRSEAIDYQYLTEENSGVDIYWNQQKENAENVQKKLDEVCFKIRERIGLLVVVDE